MLSVVYRLLVRNTCTGTLFPRGGGRTFSFWLGEEKTVSLWSDILPEGAADTFSL